MTKSITDPLSDLVATFNFRRALSLIAIILILGATAWTIDYYTNYSRLSRIEREVSLFERVDAIDRRGAIAKDLTEIRANLVGELTELSARQIKVSQIPSEGGFAAWFRRIWPKFVAGALPWFVISLTAIPALFKKEKNSWAGFVALQFLTLFFGFAVTVIPPTEYRVVDYVLIPWGLLFSIGVIPMSIGMAAGYKKVREASLQRAIMNNLRQISAAADQYFLEHGVAEVALIDLVGSEPTKFIKSLIIVDGERYEGLIIRQGEPIAVYRRSGEPVIYNP